MLCIYEIATSDQHTYLVKQLDRPHAGHLTNQSLHTLIGQYRQTHDQILVLLDERHFVMAHEHQTHHAPQRYTAQELHDNCLSLSKELHLQHHIPGKQLYYHIHNIIVNEHFSDYLIGMKGDLSRDTTCIYIKNDTAALLDQHRDIVNVVPQSLTTIHHVQQLLRKDSFSLVWMYDDFIKAVHVQDGQYVSSNTLNRWTKMLMDIVIDNGVGEYFSNTEKIPNPLAEKLLSESFSFYCKTVSQRLREETTVGSDLILISDMIKHQLFMKIFQEKYHTDSQGYIVPLHVPPHEDKYITSSDMIFTMQYGEYLKRHLIPCG